MTAEQGARSPDLTLKLLLLFPASFLAPNFFLSKETEREGEGEGGKGRGGGREGEGEGEREIGSSHINILFC